MEITVGMNKFNEQVYVTAKTVSEVYSPKGKRKVNARKKPPLKQKMDQKMENL